MTNGRLRAITGVKDVVEEFRRRKSSFAWKIARIEPREVDSAADSLVPTAGEARAGPSEQALARRTEARGRRSELDKSRKGNEPQRLVNAVYRSCW